MHKSHHKHYDKTKNIDFNCNLAQGFGIYKNELEPQFLDYVSSVNISAGLHAGDPLTINKALLQAKEKNVVIGASIGFNDLQGFGLRPMSLSKEDTEALVIYQIGAISALASSLALEIEFVRPHGAMYEMAATDFEFASNIVNAVKKYSQWLTYVGQAGEIIDRVAQELSIPVAREINLAKNYNADLSIDTDKEDITDINTLRMRFQKYMNYSQSMM